VTDFLSTSQAFIIKPHQNLSNLPFSEKYASRAKSKRGCPEALHVANRVRTVSCQNHPCLKVSE
jgi:hypothetical protein